jgi:predicted HicB family RNase H-like nuclease
MSNQFKLSSLFLTEVIRSDSIRLQLEDGMPKTETLNLRVSSEFKRRLFQEAKKEKRSVTNYVEATLASLWKVRATPKRDKAN